METMTVTKISTSVLAMYFHVLWLYTVPLPSSRRRKSMVKILKYFVSDHHNDIVTFIAPKFSLKIDDYAKDGGPGVV